MGWPKKRWEETTTDETKGNLVDVRRGIATDRAHRRRHGWFPPKALHHEQLWLDFGDACVRCQAQPLGIPENEIEIEQPAKQNSALHVNRVGVRIWQQVDARAVHHD